MDLLPTDVEPVVVWVPPTAADTAAGDRGAHSIRGCAPRPTGRSAVHLPRPRAGSGTPPTAQEASSQALRLVREGGRRSIHLTALFHAVGGLPHFTHAYPVIVCREDLDLAETLSFAWLMTVNERRIDLRNHEGLAGSSEKVLVVKLARSLSAGPGASLPSCCCAMAWPTRWRFSGLEAASSAALSAGHDTVHVVFAVPNVNGLHHLLVGRLSLQMANASRDGDLPLAWCPTSDERPSISQRRDVSRPVSAFLGRRVALIGCGGLGSWIAEYTWSAQALPRSSSLTTGESAGEASCPAELRRRRRRRSEVKRWPNDSSSGPGLRRPSPSAATANASARSCSTLTPW